ncbi:hypothetical protein G4B88_027165 [Cannabis sativa]|uniref:Uncharacterized protein n=1 Tax=Cannabis sativa TaxID=3483 RepID=A0A7J6HQZ2_CANSA|nr:hypothetical protein G4B88_027165 [Cannabis sativa]
MKREGRQHGMVRTLRILPSPLNPRPETRFVNRFDSPATAGLFTRVSTKPTGHSKFTGKCGQPRCNGCHLHPTCKAKDKTKGNMKLKSNDVIDDETGVENIIKNNDDDDEKEERMSFCDVGFVLEQEEDDGWCLVGEM